MPKDLSIQKILSILLSHIKLIILITLTVTVIAFGYSKFFIKPMYSSSAIILVQNHYSGNQTPTEETTSSTDQRVWDSDLSTSAKLADFCTVLFMNSPQMTSVLEGCSLSITSENETNFLRLTVSCNDPQKAADVAKNVCNVAPEVFMDVYKAGQVDVIKPASVPTSPSSPDIKKNVMFGFLGGLVLSILISLFLDIIDTTIKPDDDLFKMYGIPVLAEVVDFER